MREFKDNENSKWSIDLPVGAVMRVRSASDNRFNLFEPQAKIENSSGSKVSLLDALNDDLPTFWEFLWHLVEPQSAQRQIDAAKFGQLMAADCLLLAQAAFMEEWRDFFLKLQQPDKALALEKTAKYREKARLLMTAKLKDPTLDAMDSRVAAKQEAEANAWLGNLQGLLDSTLGPSPSGNSG